MMGMMKYEGMKESGQSLSDLLSQMPRSLQALFGGRDLNTAIGFYSVIFLYLLLLGAIHAVMLGSGIISKEEQDKTYEFILTKPVSRERLITFKLLAALTDVFIINIIIFLSSASILMKLGEQQQMIGDLVLLSIGLFFHQLLFLAIGLVLASARNFPKKASALSMAILLFLFMMSVFASMFESLDFLKYLTPFYYFDARRVLGESLNGFLILFALVLTGGFTYYSYRFYHDRDLGC
jgi:ABC-2 type transport system permease protein